MLSAFVLLAFTASCAIDDKDACGEHQKLVTRASGQQFRVCVCDEASGYVFDTTAGRGCKLCEKGTTAKNGACTKAVTAVDAGATAGSGGSDEDGGMTDAGKPAMSEAVPTGLGEPCMSSADCASFDATFCDSFQSHSCLVEKCATGENACPKDTTCCDFSALLAGLSICTADDQLVAGECPMGGKRVEP
jgi:hypothetical protein